MYVVEVYSCDVLTVCDRGTEDQLAAPVTCPLPFPLYFVFIVIPHHHHRHHYYHHPSFIIVKIHQLGPNNQVIASLPDYNFQTPRFDGFHIDEQANGKSSVHNSQGRAFSVSSKFLFFLLLSDLVSTKCKIILLGNEQFLEKTQSVEI